MRNVVLAGACRTPIGTMGGALSSKSAVELGTLVISEAFVPASEVDMVYMGCVIQAALGQNVARQCALKAGLPVETPAMTLNVVCGSGLAAVNMGAALIASGDADIVVAGGTESMSNAPFALPKARFGYRMNNGTLVDTMVNDALWDAFNDYHMGITAENVAERWCISRQELDEFSAASQQKCARAMETGRFKDEIVPVTVKQKKQTVVVDTDEGPRPTTTVEILSKLKPAFKPDGALAGVDPAVMGVGPVAASQKAMAKAGLTVADFDLIEANEAFAAQSVAVARELHFDPEKLNVNGGAIALGHPVGASGCRILVTLLHEMQKRDAKKGLATLCIGGGMGCAAIVERD